MATGGQSDISEQVQENRSGASGSFAVQDITVEEPTDLPRFGDKPMKIKCPHCDAGVVETEVKYTSGLVSWILCLVMVFWGLWLGCCLVPFLINGCKDCTHFCPSCKEVLGKYIREERYVLPLED